MLGLWKFEVILVRNLLYDMFVDVIRFSFLWICCLIVLVIFIVSKIFCLFFVILRNVLFNDRGLIRLVYLWNILCIWWEMDLYIFICLGIKINCGYRCFVFCDDIVEWIL